MTPVERDADMMRATARVATDKAARYLSQLCKHFAHRLPASLDDEGGGRIDFPFGSCALAADEAALHLSLEATSAPDLRQLEQVIAAHLKRFAFREPVEVAWSGG